MQNSSLNQINKSLMRNFHPHSCVVSELIFLWYQAMLLDKYARCTELVNYSWIISYRNANCQNFELSLIAEKYDKHYYALVHQLHHIRVQGWQPCGSCQFLNCPDFWHKIIITTDNGGRHTNAQGNYNKWKIFISCFGVL